MNDLAGKAGFLSSPCKWGAVAKAPVRIFQSCPDYRTMSEGAGKGAQRSDGQTLPTLPKTISSCRHMIRSTKTKPLTYTPALCSLVAGAIPEQFAGRRPHLRVTAAGFPFFSPFSLLLYSRPFAPIPRLWPRTRILPSAQAVVLVLASHPHLASTAMEPIFENTDR